MLAIAADCLPHARRICDRLRGERPCAGSRQSERPRSFASGLADAWAAIQGMTPARRAQIATNAAAKRRTSHPSKRKARRREIAGSHKGHCGRRSDRTHGTGRPAYPATPLKIYVYGYLKSCSLEATNRFCARSYQTRQDHSSAEGALHGIERILHERLCWDALGC